MTKKRFKLRLSKLGNGMITDTQKRDDLYFDKEFLDTILPKTNEWLNKLAEENEELKSDNNRLVNETAKIIGEHQRKVLNLIDRKIKDYNQQLDDEDIDDNLAYYMNVKGHIEAFKELKKELSE